MDLLTIPRWTKRLSLARARPSSGLSRRSTSQLAELKSPLAIEFRPGDKVKSDQDRQSSPKCHAQRCLEGVEQADRPHLVPWGQNIVVVAKEDQVNRQLDRTISVRFNAAEVGQVLTELSLGAGVDFSIEPGQLQRVPADFRRITLVLDNARIREALEDIRGVTGWITW